MNRKRKNFIFTNKKHSHRAIMSVILGTISIVSLGTVIYLTCLADGEAANGYSVTGVLAMIFSLVGLILGIVTVQEKNYYRFFPWMGVLLNLISLGSIAVILYLGNVL